LKKKNTKREVVPFSGENAGKTTVAEPGGVNSPGNSPAEGRKHGHSTEKKKKGSLRKRNPVAGKMTRSTTKERGIHMPPRAHQKKKKKRGPYLLQRKKGEEARNETPLDAKKTVNAPRTWIPPARREETGPKNPIRKKKPANFSGGGYQGRTPLREGGRAPIGSRGKSDPPKRGPTKRPISSGGKQKKEGDITSRKARGGGSRISERNAPSPKIHWGLPFHRDFERRGENHTFSPGVEEGFAR